MSVCVVVGGQFGSEGKGALVARIAQQYDHHVRVGAANAGHTLYTPTRDNDLGMAHGGEDTGDYEKHVMQQIPCAAYANPAAELYIGPGAQISPPIFLRELRLLDMWRLERGMPTKVIHVDPRAHVITDRQIHAEAQSELAERIGSTSTIAREGIGAAMADRVMRSDECVTAAQFFTDDKRFDGSVDLMDVPMALDAVDDILLEGTQGTGLSITTGYFPFCTSRNTTAAGLCADAGVGATRVDRVIVVARTYPIRVAGNSGPFHPESTELTWDDLGIDEENERTTVTKKIRRVASLSLEQLRESAALNGATEIALMFADYSDHKLAGLDCVEPSADEFAWRSLPLAKLCYDIYAMAGVPVTFLGTGPRTMVEFHA